MDFFFLILFIDFFFSSEFCDKVRIFYATEFGFQKCNTQIPADLFLEILNRNVIERPSFRASLVEEFDYLLV